LTENENKFPVVLLIAKEILVVHVLTVAIEQAFSERENIELNSLKIGTGGC
jgi:hypothetical protein